MTGKCPWKFKNIYMLSCGHILNCLNRNDPLFYNIDINLFTNVSNIYLSDTFVPVILSSYETVLKTLTKYDIVCIYI